MGAGDDVYVDITGTFGDHTGLDKTTNRLQGIGGLYAATHGTAVGCACTVPTSGNNIWVYHDDSGVPLARLVYLTTGGSYADWAVGDEVRDNGGGGVIWSGIICGKEDDSHFWVELAVAYTHAHIDTADGITNTTEEPDEDDTLSAATCPGITFDTGSGWRMWGTTDNATYAYVFGTRPTISGGGEAANGFTFKTIDGNAIFGIHPTNIVGTCFLGAAGTYADDWWIVDNKASLSGVGFNVADMRQNHCHYNESEATTGVGFANCRDFFSQNRSFNSGGIGIDCFAGVDCIGCLAAGAKAQGYDLAAGVTISNSIADQCQGAGIQGTNEWYASWGNRLTRNQTYGTDGTGAMRIRYAHNAHCFNRTADFHTADIDADWRHENHSEAGGSCANSDMTKTGFTNLTLALTYSGGTNMTAAQAGHAVKCAATGMTGIVVSQSGTDITGELIVRAIEGEGVQVGDTIEDDEDGVAYDTGGIDDYDLVLDGDYPCDWTLESDAEAVQEEDAACDFVSNFITSGWGPDAPAGGSVIVIDD